MRKLIAMLPLLIVSSAGTASAADELSCVPARLSDDGAVMLKWHMPEARSLIIRAPDGHDFCISCDHHLARNQIEPAELPAAGHFGFDTSSFMADPFQYGVTEFARVFTKSGRYTVIITDEFGSDAPGIVRECVIDYKVKTMRRAN